ncbi:preprotein translocase subunit SecY [Sphingomonas hankyongi]|uniref:Protein translocase subunit SecY n=1 Tax=Sphingomonas hankyongi TaxID=2908209 RepID=A0ABT0RZ03_9SPHN|nr:preprotein translocase subunit SecY [Sphingomonas hankyongi]MCL6728838.1 preprotein translocase subunit SecY [Sphingomonas hankyongi]
MASAAEQLASSISLANFSKATELKKRLWFTLGALILFRLLSFVPVPGIDPVAMQTLYQTQSGGILDVFNTFSGGALERFSIIALGVMPYITASIVVQLGATLYPSWQQLRKEGETGRKKLNQYTRYLTVAITLVQGYLAIRGLESQSVNQGIQAVVQPGLLFEIAGTVSLVGGTLFLMWIGEQITSRGIGNGVSLIIMAGIVARLPQGIAQLLEGSRTGTLNPLVVVGIVAIAAALVLFICFMERAQRRVLIQYPKRQTARGMQQERSHLPIKLNTAGVIPPIFASSLLLMPLTILQWAGNRTSAEGSASDWLITVSTYLQHGSPLYMLLYGLGIAFFCFFYTAVQFNSEETADNLKRHGGFIPGIRPGKATEQYFDYLLNRITVVGAAYLVLICLIPEMLTAQAGLSFRLGGTSLLIVVNVTMDTVSQIQSHLIAHQYGDLIKKAKLKTTPRRR